MKYNNVQLQNFFIKFLKQMIQFQLKFTLCQQKQLTSDKYIIISLYINILLLGQ